MHIQCTTLFSFILSLALEAQSCSKTNNLEVHRSLDCVAEPVGLS